MVIVTLSSETVDVVLESFLLAGQVDGQKEDVVFARKSHGIQILLRAMFGCNKNIQRDFSKGFAKVFRVSKI